MHEIASHRQLRSSYLRWAMVTVPAVVLLGFAIARVTPSGTDNAWYNALSKPEWQPPGWAFPVAWSALYVMMGLAIALILSARGARGRGVAVALFAAQLVVNLAWSPMFFGAHLVSFSVIHIAIIFGLAVATTIAFGRIRPLAAWLMVPYLGWLSFAFLLALEIDRRNPDGETLVPPGPSTQIEL